MPLSNAAETSKDLRTGLAPMQHRHLGGTNTKFSSERFLRACGEE